MEDVLCSHGCEDELLGHLPGELIDGPPAGAVGRYDEIRAYLLHLFNCRADDWLKSWPGEVKTTQNCVNLARLCDCLDVFDRVYDASMGTSTDGWGKADAFAILPLDPKHFMTMFYAGPPSIRGKDLSADEVHFWNFEMMKCATKEIYSKYP